MNWDMSNNNGFTYRDVYATAPGATTGQDATGGTSAAPSGAVMPGTNDAATRAASIGAQGNVVIGGIVFFGLVFGLMFLAQRLGTGDDFKALKPSVYNVVTIALAAVAGIPVIKYGFTKFPIPGVTAWVQSV